jgi:hypothetical protein
MFIEIAIPMKNAHPNTKATTTICGIRTAAPA